MLREIGKWFDDKASETRRKLATASLSKTLSRNIELAKLHKAAGLKQSDPVFKALQADADKAITVFCDHWNSSPRDIEKQVPGLQVLKRLASDSSNEQNQKRQEMFAKATKGIGLSGVALAIYFGVLVRIFHFTAYTQWHWPW